MFRALILLALWAASPLPGQVGSTAVYTEFKQTPSAAVVQAMREEVNSLLASSGLRVDWRSLSFSQSESFTELAVVTFRGRCEVLPFADNLNADRRLGWTHITDSVVLPFAEVDCDAVLAYLLPALAGSSPETRQKVYGRALGRVVAHELLHVFAGTAHHSAHGVDQPSLSRAELLADHLTPDSRAIPILRTEWTAAAMTGGGSAEAGRDSYLRNGCAGCHGTAGEGTRRGPVLRAAGRISNAVVLAVKLTKSQDKMSKRARKLKLATPSLSEEELPDLVRFFNGFAP